MDECTASRGVAGVSVTLLSGGALRQLRGMCVLSWTADIGTQYYTPRNIILVMADKNHEKQFIFVIFSFSFRLTDKYIFKFSCASC